MTSKHDLPPLLVRADAGAEIGAGHVMRCLALAHAWKNRGGPVALLSSRLETSLSQSYEEIGALVTDVGEPYPSGGDLRATITAIQKASVYPSRSAWVALDGYHFDLKYQNALRSAGARVIVMDDTARLARYDADIVWNHALAAPSLDYPCSPDTQLLLGTRFALLRPEFQKWQNFTRRCPAVARKILITLGGSDNDNVTLRIVQALTQLEDTVEIKIITGPLYKHLFELQTYIAPLGRVSIAARSMQVAPIMDWADLAIAAGGTTAWELAFMQIPAILVTLADNQIGVVQALDEFGCAMGCLGSPNALTSRRIADATVRLIGDARLRQQMSEKGRALVDGRGAERVVDAMRYRPGDRALQVRMARPQDAVLLWVWANESSTRRNSFASKRIAWADHERWYAEKMSSNDVRIWILEYGRVPVGQIRYERAGADRALIGLAVARSYRGRGFGARLLELTAPLARRELAVSTVEGIAFAENVASQRSFAGAGFSLVEKKRLGDHDCVIYRLSEPAFRTGACHVPAY